MPSPMMAARIAAATAIRRPMRYSTGSARPTARTLAPRQDKRMTGIRSGKAVAERKEGEAVGTATSALERSVESRTMADMLLGATQQHEGAALKFKRDGDWTEISYAELGEHVKANAKGLLALGIEPGDRVSILGETSPEWTVADLAALCIGAVVAPIHHTNSPDECRHVLQDSEAKLVFCENAEQLAKIEEVMDAV